MTLTYAEMQPPAEIRPFREIDDAPRAQGPDGQKIRSIWKSVFGHWMATESSRLDICGQLDDPNYSALPAKRRYSIPVKYRYVGRGKPIPYPLDDLAE